MALNRRQVLQIALLGWMGLPAKAQTPGEGWFGNILGLPTHTDFDYLPGVKQPPKGGPYPPRYYGIQQTGDGKTNFRKWKRVLATEWHQLWLLSGRRVFGRKVGEKDDAPLWEIPVSRKGNELKFGKPIPTPYVDIMISPERPTVGIRSIKIIEVPSDHPSNKGQLVVDNIHVLDWFDSDGEVITTLHNVALLGGPVPYGEVFRVGFMDPSGNSVLGFLDKKGQLTCPLLPEPKQFIYTKTVNEYPLYTVLVDKEKNLYLPVNEQGQFPTDAIKIRGYYPDIAFPPPGVADTPFIGSRTVLIDGWLKEYDLEGSLAYGWVSKDLKRETGPVWRSMHRLPAPYPECMLGELLDGTWMVYKRAHWKQQDAGLPSHEPMLPEPAPTRDEALRRLPPFYDTKITQPREEARQKELEDARRYWEQRSKDNIALLIAHAYKPGQSKETPTELQRIAETIRELQSLAEKARQSPGFGYETKYRQELEKLPHDWMLRYLRYGATSFSGQKFAFTSQDLESYAKSAQNPALAAEFRTQAATVREQEEARKRAEAKAAEELKKRQEEWKKQGNPTAPRAPSGHVYTAPPSATWVYKPQPASTSPGLGQYLKDLYEYGRGRDWKPVYR